MTTPRLEPAAEQAIDWMVALRATPGDSSQRLRFEQWLAADPRHSQAWTYLQDRVRAPYERLRALGRQMPGHAQQAREVLLEPPLARRTVIRAMAALGVLGSSAWLGAQTGVGQAWLADISTGIGERRRLTLPDGSLLTLNACSAVDLRFAARERCVRVRRGEVMIEAQADPRPFQVRSEQALVSTAAPGRWLVSQQAQTTVVTALRGRVQVQGPNGAQTQQVTATQAVRIDAQGVYPLGAQAWRGDWVDGLYSAVDESLQTLVDALRPYCAGVIRVSPDARALRVQGVFSLDRPEQALHTMAQALPVRIERYGPWWVQISRRA